MSTPSLIPTEGAVTYPDSDGQPMAENTLQFQYIVLIKENLEILFKDRPDVFIAGDLFWYPVEGSNTIRQAPDVMVAFGRRKGHRGSYKQWEEGGIAPQVVFEILSPGNRRGEMEDKFAFYRRYGVQEYYVYDPDHGRLEGYEREGDELVEVVFMQGWTSPRLQVRFQLVGKELELYRPDGGKFITTLELVEQFERQRQRAEQERQRAEQLRQRAEQERADKERALHEAEQQRQRVEQLEQLLAKLKAGGQGPGPA